MVSGSRARTVSLIVFADETTRSTDLVRCLHSARPFVDSWHIVSSSPIRSTFEHSVQNALASKPGDLRSEVGVDPATLRSEAFCRVAKTTDYVLLLNATNELVVENGYNIDALKSTLNRTVYRLLVKSGSSVRAQPALLNASYGFYFRGEIEPILDCHDTVESIGEIDGIHVRNDDLSPRRRNVEDVLVANNAELEQLSQEATDMKLRSHYALLAAKGHQRAGRFQQARDWFEQVAQYGGSEDEVCDALLETGHCARMQFLSSSRVLETYLRAHDTNPRRAEPLYYAARSLREANRTSLAYIFAKAAASTKRPAIGSSLELDVYEWRALFELSIVAFYVDEHSEGLFACQSLLTNPSLPEAERALTRTNLGHYVRALSQIAS
jgi:hypothetical protein